MEVAAKSDPNLWNLTPFWLVSTTILNPSWTSSSPTFSRRRHPDTIKACQPISSLRITDGVPSMTPSFLPNPPLHSNVVVCQWFRVCSIQPICTFLTAWSLWKVLNLAPKSKHSTIFDPTSLLGLDFPPFSRKLESSFPETTLTICENLRSDNRP